MGKSKIKTMLLASVMIMLCATMIVGGTYALWTSDVKVENHLVAGSLNAELWRNQLNKTYLNEAGGLSNYEDKAAADFSGSTTKNMFGLGAKEKIAPGSSYAARLSLINKGSVAFDFVVKIKLNGATNALSNQLKVLVWEGAEGEEKYAIVNGTLSDFVEGGKHAEIHSGTLNSEKSTEFTVKIVFVDDTKVNNNAQAQEVSFDLFVNAVQNTEAK